VAQSLRKSADVLSPYLKEKGGLDASRAKFDAIHSSVNVISSAVGFIGLSTIIMVFSRCSICV
jgi:hypothetical protein